MDQASITPVAVSTTADSEETLSRIATMLIEKELAACCQLSRPIKSVYRWQGKIETSLEYRCSIKTVSSLIDAVIASIKELHNYDEPEIIVTEIVGGSESYLQWIFDSVRKS